MGPVFCALSYWIHKGFSDIEVQAYYGSAYNRGDQTYWTELHHCLSLFKLFEDQ